MTTTMPENLGRLATDAGKCGRANGKDTMARPRYQDGSLFIRGKRTKVWVARWREDVIREDGTLNRTQRTVVLGSITELSRREARSLLQKRVSEINQGRHRARPMMTLERFAREHWQAGALLALKPSSASYYNFQLDKHVLPVLGSYRLCDLSRPVVQQFLLERSARDIQALPSMEFAPRWLRCYKRRWSMATLKSILQGQFKSARENLNRNEGSCHLHKSERF